MIFWLTVDVFFLAMSLLGYTNENEKINNDDTVEEIIEEIIFKEINIDSC